MMTYTRTNGTVVAGAALALSLIASPFVTAADQPLAGGDPGRDPLILAQMGGMGGMDKGMEGCGKNMGAMMHTDKDGTLDQSEMGHMGKMMESHCAGMPMKRGMGGDM
jgi:hypothetical protein